MRWYDYVIMYGWIWVIVVIGGLMAVGLWELLWKLAS